MSYKMIRHTTETIWNNYEMVIDDAYCEEMTQDFTRWNYFIFAKITPEYVKWVMEDGCMTSTQATLSEAEQTFINEIYDYVDADIWDADMWTNDSEVDNVNDTFEDFNE